MADAGPWWGDHEIEIGTRSAWRIGPLSLWVQRLEREWVVSWLRGDANDRTLELARTGAEAPPVEAETQRMAGGPDTGPLELSARLPDRPFVARPETTLAVVPGGEVTIYLSLPVTVAINHGAPLLEVLSYRPSDTWLGATPRDGQLAYFTRTRAMTSLTEWTHNPGRVLSALHLRNHTATSVQVPRVSVPAQQLGVYADSEHRLSSEDLNIDFRISGGHTEAEVSLASVRTDLTLVCAPRIVPDRHRLARVMRGIFE